VIDRNETRLCALGQPVADVALLAETDALHDALGSRYPALDAARWASGTPRYARLAFISVAHLYRLRADFGDRARHA
jgi:hypothetical protein